MSTTARTALRTPLRRLLMVVAAVALLLGVPSVPAGAASAAVAADAETGTLAAWSATAAASATSGAATQGAFGYEVNSANGPGYLNWSTTAIEQAHMASVREQALRLAAEEDPLEEG